MHLEGLVEEARRHALVEPDGSAKAARPLRGLLVLRRDTPSPVESSLYQPVLCVILEGEKQVSLAGQDVVFGAGQCLLVSHDVPVRSRITQAPYLSLVLELDLVAIRGLEQEVAGALTVGGGARTAETHHADPGLLDALRRYLALADSPVEARVLGPVVSKEIHYRLLTASFGGMLRSLVLPSSHASSIARAITQIRGDLRSPIAVPDLARRVGMSASAFHKHFKAITATTPLQYQKELRLLEAQRLLRTGGVTVNSAAYEVGYESSSQFSREYARKFGAPPSQDLRRI